MLIKNAFVVKEEIEFEMAVKLYLFNSEGKNKELIESIKYIDNFL